MKRSDNNRRSTTNGVVPTRKELLDAHERSIQRTAKMTAKEGLEALVRAGIVTRAGKLARRYGGRAENQDPVSS